MQPLKCVVCGKQPDSAIPTEDSHQQPYAATTFKAFGQYGSTVYDPFSTGPIEEWLEINICDECVKVAGAQGRVMRVEAIPQPAQYATQLWEASRASSND